LGRVQRRLTVGEACGAGGDNGVALQHRGVKGEVKSVPKWKDTELWLTGEKEDGGAWVKNWLRDGEIRCSGWPNGGSGFHGVSPECFIVGGSSRTKGEQRGKMWRRPVAYKASNGQRREGGSTTVTWWEEWGEGPAGARGGGEHRSVTKIRPRRAQAARLHRVRDK
jgi:hypothetical protein